ncbi:MAG: GNAT family N-acetyltransferase [Acidimicrobiales bacterium]
MSTIVIDDNPGARRYELLVDGTLASLTEYRLHGQVADFVHTETRDGFGGEGYGTRLIRAALDDAGRRGWQVRPFCPFVKRFMVEHPEYQVLVPDTDRPDFFGG